jgi:hypothetical protein
MDTEHEWLSRRSAPIPSIAALPGCLSAGRYGFVDAANATASAKALAPSGVDVSAALLSAACSFLVRSSRLESQSGQSNTVVPASHSHSAFDQALLPPGQLTTQ